MRELSSDCPDETESPYTVDAGHFQLEMDFANYTHNKTAAQRQSMHVAQFNFKVGLFNTVDLQVVYDNYLNVN